MRPAVWNLGAAALLSVLVRSVLPLPPDDPFRLTLILLPVILTGLLEVGRWARSRGGAGTPAPVAAAESVLFILLLLLVLGRGHLGLPFGRALADAPLAAGLAALLIHRVARLTLALRPALGRRMPQSPPPAFLFLPLLVYLAILPWSTGHRPPDGDEPYYLLITHSLAHDLDADLTNNYAQGDSLDLVGRQLEPQTGDPVGPEGELYSRHNVLLPLLLAPAYRLAGKHGAMAVMALLTAILAWLALRLAGRLFPERPRECLLAYALLAFTPPLLLYSYQVWVEVPAAILLILACERILAQEEEGDGGWRKWLALALPLALLPLLKLRFALIVGPLLLLALWRGERRARRLILLIGSALGLVAVAILLYNRAVYDNPLKYLRVPSMASFMQSPVEYAEGLVGLFWDNAFGLFACAPIWLLLLPALALLTRKRLRPLAWLALCFLPYYLVLAPRGWYGSWSPPFRYGLVALPVLSLMLIPLFEHRRRGGARLVLAGLAGLTLILTLLWLAVPGWTYNLAHGRNHLIDHLASGQGADIARFFPSSTRPRLATWIWPPATLLLIGGLWWLPIRRLRRPAVWGTLGLLAAVSGLLAAAHRTPTRVIELEDTWVDRQGGRLHPELWVPGRPRYRGGWVLGAGETLTAPIVSGGRTLSLELEMGELDPPGPSRRLEIVAGESVLAHRSMRPKRRFLGWRVEDLDWPSGVPLTLRVESTGRTDGEIDLLFDRARLEWH